MLSECTFRSPGRIFDASLDEIVIPTILAVGGHHQHWDTVSPRWVETLCRWSGGKTTSTHAKYDCNSIEPPMARSLWLIRMPPLSLGVTVARPVRMKFFRVS
jgi:hypothetical protein